MLKINELTVCHGYVQALWGVTLEAKKGELLAILGNNGAGKSTLLGTIAGLYKVVTGDIVLGDKPLSGCTTEQLVGQGISLVPEQREIFSNLSVRDNLMLGAFHRYHRHKKELHSDIGEILEIFPALKGKQKELAGSLSGGLQQMLAIGRGLMAHPSLLLLDEPSIGLAPIIVGEIMSVLDQLKKDGVTIILVEQNSKAALKVADRVLVMERGKITKNGSVEEMGDSLLQEAYLGKSPLQAVETIGSPLSNTC